jgi:hypothetical protein
MSNAAIDTNSKQTITARLKSDGVTVTRLIANPVTGALGTTTITAGAVTPSNFSATDDNGRTSWFAVSEFNSKQLVALQCDANGNLLIKTI